MAGVSTGTGRGGKRTVDQEINMVPFIDLLMVTISFLLITAVWTASGRLQTSTQMPGEKSAAPKQDPTVLHVRVASDENGRAKNARLEWQTGNKTEDVATVSLAGGDQPLEDAIAKAYHVGIARGTLAADPVTTGIPNQVVLHVPAALPMAEVAHVIDVIYAPKVANGAAHDGRRVPAFQVTFSAT